MEGREHEGKLLLAGAGDRQKTINIAPPAEAKRYFQRHARAALHEMLRRCEVAVDERVVLVAIEGGASVDQHVDQIQLCTVFPRNPRPRHERESVVELLLKVGYV